MLKITGVLLISVSVAMIGFLFCEKLSDRRKMILIFEKIALSVPARLRCGSKDIISVLQSFYEIKAEFIADLDGAVLVDRKELTAYLRKHGADIRDVEDYCDFLSGLTANDIKGIEKLCSVYSERFRIASASVSEELSDKGRIVKSLSIFGAAAVFIILV